MTSLELMDITKEYVVLSKRAAVLRDLIHTPSPFPVSEEALIELEKIADRLVELRVF